MDALAPARELVARIEAAGGPPPHRAATFYAIRDALGRAELGLPILVPLGFLVGGAAIGWLASTFWETGQTFTRETTRLIETAGTAGRLLIWGGVLLLAWQAFGRGR